MLYENAIKIKEALVNPRPDIVDENGCIRISPEFRDLLLPYIDMQIPIEPKLVDNAGGLRIYRCVECGSFVYERNGDESCPTCGKRQYWNNIEKGE